MTSSRWGAQEGMTNEVAGASASAEATGAAPDRVPRYTLRPVTRQPAVKPASGGLGESRGAAVKSEGFGRGVRAEGEDDDGYDPYSDYHDGNAGDPVFEEDPWR